MDNKILGTPGTTSKPATTPTVHSVLVNGSGLKQQPYYSQKITSQSYTSSSPYATLVSVEVVF